MHFLRLSVTNKNWINPLNASVALNCFSKCFIPKNFLKVPRKDIMYQTNDFLNAVF